MTGNNTSLLVVSDGKLKMTGNNTSLLVVPGGITSQLQNLGGQVLHDGGKVDGSSSTNTFSVVSFAKETVDTANRKLKTSSRRSGLCLSLNFASFSSSRHDVTLMIRCVQQGLGD